ncbi:MAG: acetyl-CoA carboxylase biotin carboxyl carrier protein [Alphaproteobacteria bacterium]|nr:acetyl-CoA carboxylase biotin carboxyl carrier protein [Alphaproteobacteria bacterium]MDE2011327.1 acetyl-CoA carboxylase biotin carboxyl carrier protein [Alphaproteobacteria bacterium]MDE2073179.1 acetyl-CoA carboxylase biotin carboxyl carrier protein [Alphaproteobacteria bacterium]MDE2350260.1 acetyl-CoA carboxylase biotin carboxyl carrier protein [Alphaproteobacteria bacterium]
MTNKDAGKSKAIDAEAIRELAELLSETSLTEIEVEQNGLRIRVSRQGLAVHAPVPAMPALNHVAAAHAEAPAAKRDGHAPGTVTSPMVGTVYVAPEPGAAPFVKVGDVVKEGDTLMIVEAMKTMNPIVAPRGGSITEICIHDAEPVEFGQALIVIG